MHISKHLFRTPLVQNALATVLAGWVRLCIATTRWTFHNATARDSAVAHTGGVLGCFWHSRLLLASAAWPLKQRPAHVLISLSPDGASIARMAELLGLTPVRGSSAKKSAPDKAKGGSRAFRDMARLLDQGAALAITPDGPRGPAEVMPAGPAVLAHTAGVPVLCIGAATHPVIRFNSWDRFCLPLPFARGAIVYSDLIWSAAEKDTETLRADLQAAMQAATVLAEQQVR